MFIGLGIIINVALFILGSLFIAGMAHDNAMSPSKFFQDIRLKHLFLLLIPGIILAMALTKIIACLLKGFHIDSSIWNTSIYRKRDKEDY